jgi:hypothetical protein
MGKRSGSLACETESYKPFHLEIGRDAFLLKTQRRKKTEKLSACRGEGSAAGLQLRVRFVWACCAAGGIISYQVNALRLLRQSR